MHDTILAGRKLLRQYLIKMILNTAFQKMGFATLLVEVTTEIKNLLRSRGVETFHGEGTMIDDSVVFEPPCSIKWMNIEAACTVGAFSYAVSGTYTAVEIGRYTSIGADVQVGRASHPLTWVSTSPFFYLQEQMFDLGNEFLDAEDYHLYRASEWPNAVATRSKPIVIGNDVYVGHGAMIMPGVTIGDGAVVGAMAVVTKNVPPYAIVGGNPARIIRMRHDQIIAGQLLFLRWWDFAPWQLKNINFADPEQAIEGIKSLSKTATRYKSISFKLADLLDENTLGNNQF
jgi:acetyltransferase-like isoleucine patch superfamily enzyme